MFDIDVMTDDEIMDMYHYLMMNSVIDHAFGYPSYYLTWCDEFSAMVSDMRKTYTK